MDMNENEVEEVINNDNTVYNSKEDDNKGNKTPQSKENKVET